MNKYLFLALLVGGILLGGCAQTGTETTTTTSSAVTTTTLAAATETVSISNFAFVPNNLEISVETIVVWTNNDSVTHTVTSTSGPASFNSGFLTLGGQYQHQFTVIGTYEYHCSLHTGMTGTITVR